MTRFRVTVTGRRWLLGPRVVAVRFADTQCGAIIAAKHMARELRRDYGARHCRITYSKEN